MGSQSRYKSVKVRAKEDQVIVGYLLGLATEMEQGQVETRYFRDQDFYEQVLALEDELICDYLSNELTGTERRRFEEHFLQTAHRRKKFQATRKLMAYLADQGVAARGASPAISTRPVTKTQTTNPATGGLLDSLGGLLAPKLALGWMAAATAVLLVCGFWLTGKITNLRQSLRQSESERIALQQQRENLRGTASRQRAEVAAKRDEANSLSELVASGANTLSASMERHVPSMTPILKLSLATARSANKPADLRLSKEIQATLIAISLESDLSEASRYQVKMRAVETSSPTWQWEAVPQSRQLMLEIPTHSLAAGLYSLTVKRIEAPRSETESAEGEFIGEIFLRVWR